MEKREKGLNRNENKDAVEVIRTEHSIGVRSVVDAVNVNRRIIDLVLNSYKLAPDYQSSSKVANSTVVNTNAATKAESSSGPR